MLEKLDCINAVRKFTAKHGLDAADENVIATIHLMNTHGIDVHAALDQSSRNGNDHGIDAWHFDEGTRELFVYQSKLSESRPSALKGLNDLGRARLWLERLVMDGTVEVVPSDNHCLFNLYTTLSRVRGDLAKLDLVLVSPFDSNDLEDSQDYVEFERDTIKSSLNEFIRKQLHGTITIDAAQYRLAKGIPGAVKVYPIPKIPNARVTLRPRAHLDLAYVTLDSLVALYRQRGDILFDKNVRLSLMGNKEARDRLVNPMEATLDAITSGKLSPSIFPFYHLGVTIAAAASTGEDATLLNLEAPSIINGCQTIVIANEYLKGLERKKQEAAIDVFRQIRVIAKVVVGTSNDELKEITNSNNRQNPIENWQLFSNEPIHIELEASLKEAGVFYERQKGKFDSVMKNADNAKHYFNTNGTYVKVVDLGQMITLARRNLQWAAKPSEIFLNKENHDRVFDRSISTYPRDVVFVSNLLKAMKRGLNKYLELPAHANGYAPAIFRKPNVRAHVYSLTLAHFYQSDKRRAARSEFSVALNKIASPRLVDEVQVFFQKIVTRIKSWYTSESPDLAVEISKRKMDQFFDTLAVELGIDLSEGSMPFSPSAINWEKEG